MPETGGVGEEVGEYMGVPPCFLRGPPRSLPLSLSLSLCLSLSLSLFSLSLSLSLLSATLQAEVNRTRKDTGWWSKGGRGRISDKNLCRLLYVFAVTDLIKTKVFSIRKGGTP